MATVQSLRKTTQRKEGVSTEKKEKKMQEQRKGLFKELPPEIF